MKVSRTKEKYSEACRVRLSTLVTQRHSTALTLPLPRRAPLARPTPSSALPFCASLSPDVGTDKSSSKHSAASVLHSWNKLLGIWIQVAFAQNIFRITVIADRQSIELLLQLSNGLGQVS